MSRREKRLTRRQFHELTIVCVCGLPLGKVTKQPGPDPYAVWPPLELVETPHGGKVCRRCPECRADFQRRWETLRGMLDGMEASGVSVLSLPM